MYSTGISYLRCKLSVKLLGGEPDCIMLFVFRQFKLFKHHTTNSQNPKFLNTLKQYTCNESDVLFIQCRYCFVGSCYLLFLLSSSSCISKLILSGALF